MVLKSFTSISVDQFASLVHVPVEKAVEDAMILGWERDEPANMLKPRSTLHADGDIIPNEQRISNMVGFVTFLEN